MDWIDADAWAAWATRVRAERRAGNLPALRRDALLALLACLGRDDTPTDADVAREAGCSVSTVQRARADGRALGMLAWDQTRRMVRGRWCRGPNAYRLSVPGPVSSGQVAAARRKVRKEGAQEVRRPLPSPGPIDQAAAAARVLAAWMARRRPIGTAALP
jgi:hypothetical protein